MVRLFTGGGVSCRGSVGDERGRIPFLGILPDGG